MITFPQFHAQFYASAKQLKYSPCLHLLIFLLIDLGRTTYICSALTMVMSSCLLYLLSIQMENGVLTGFHSEKAALS